MDSTSVVGAGDGAETLLPCCVPDLELANKPVHFVPLEAKINSDGWEIILDKVLVAKPEEEGRFANPLIPHNHHLESVVVLLDHPHRQKLRIYMIISPWLIFALQIQ